MQSYVYVLGSAAGGGKVRVCEKEGKCEWFVRRWGMSARIAKSSIYSRLISIRTRMG